MSAPVVAAVADAAPAAPGGADGSVASVDAPVRPEVPRVTAAAVPSLPGPTGATPPDAPVVLPEPPVVTVTLPPGDLVAGAIETRIREGRIAWPHRLPKRERDALLAFYAAMGDRPIWRSDGQWTRAAGQLVERLRHADEDGLSGADYAVPARLRAGETATPGDEADAEFGLSAAAVLYARDARGGRLDPSRLSALITPKLELPGADVVLGALASAPDPGAALQLYNPAYPGYRTLRAKLAELRAERGSAPSVRLPRREVMNTQSIAVLDDVPAPRLVPRDTSPRLEGDILANMERWRWLPSEVATRFVFVNIPEFKVRIIEDGRTVHEARAITGKPDSPTPLFSGVMEYAVVNPSWYVPPSILKKEFLPGLAADPNYAARRGYEVVRRGNQITVRQPPGERNALGFIKFMFPNQHAVYLHDTPNRNLFSASRRAFSHGCVRVDDPFSFADAVLGHEWSEQRLKRLIGRGERTIFLPRKLPVHLAYFTLSADESGELRVFEDVYGINRKVKAALGLPS